MDSDIIKLLEEDEDDEAAHSRADVEAFSDELNRDIEGNALESRQRSDPNGVMRMSSQHAMTLEISNKQSMTCSNQHPGTMLKLMVPFNMLFQIIQPQLDKDRAFQVQTLYFRVKKNEISRAVFFKHMRSIVGAEMLRLAAEELKNQAAGNSQIASTQFEALSLASQQQLQMSSSAERTTNLSKSHEVQSQADSLGTQVGTLTHMNNNAALQQNPVQLPSSTRKEQKIGVSSSMGCAKQDLIAQPNEQHNKAQMSSAQRLFPSSSVQIKQGNVSPGNLNNEYSSMLSSGIAFAAPTSMVDSHSAFTSTPRQMATNILSNSRMPSLASPIGPGKSSKAPLEKPFFGQQKPTEAPGFSSLPSSKKQKVSGAFNDQSIEQINDVTALSGVDLREEEEYLFSGSNEDGRVSEASRHVIPEEEDRLILHKISLQKKLAEIMAKCGLKRMSDDVERCLSLCVEERLRGLISNLTRLSKQHIDIVKPRHRTIITLDVKQQVMAINRKSHEEWEKKQAETEKSQKINEPESTTRVDGDKENDESCARSAKGNNEEYDKMCTTAANAAVRAATGADDMASRWKLMIEAKQKNKGIDASYGSQPGKGARKPLSAYTRNTSNQDLSEAFGKPALIRKVGRNQVIVQRVARRIAVKDVIAILEREPQMSKSTLIYTLYNKVSFDAAGE